MLTYSANGSPILAAVEARPLAARAGAKDCGRASLLFVPESGQPRHGRRGEPSPARVTHPGEVRRHLAPVTVSIAPTSTASAAAAMAASLPWPEACKGLSLPDGRSFEWLFQVAPFPPPASLPAPPAPGASIPPRHSPDPLPLTPPRPPAERPLALRPAVHRDGAEVAVAHRRRVARLVRLRRRRSSRLSSPP